MGWTSSIYDVADQENISLNPDNVIIGEATVTVARDYLSAAAESPSIVLIAIDNRDTFDVTWTGDEITPFVRNDITRSRTPTWYQQKPKAYVHLLSQLLETNSGVVATDNELLLVSMIPLLYVEAAIIRQTSNFLRKVLSQKDYGSNYSMLSPLRFRLRRRLEDSSISRSQFQKYARLRHQIDPVTDDNYRDSQLEWSTAIEDARNLEIEVRDSLQLEVGSLALEESRKSIERSDQQIQEARRGKPFTKLM